MRRARSADNSSDVSLFPFLAVLVCTMGALIVLLVVMSRQAEVRAAKTTQRASGPVVEQRAEIAQLASHVEDLAASRTAFTQQIQDDRRVLSHMEEHIDRLRDQLAKVKLAAEKLLANGKSSIEQRHRDAAEVARLQRLIAEARQLLEESRRDMERRRRSYAIVPYRGKNGTVRRPVYIECRADAVIVQPEGITLKPADFDPPLGPGNPLAAAVRAAREYLAEQPVEDDRAAGEAYPLLLVRPDGIAAYYKAREALASWNADFGYELIDADWTLALPAADPLLAQREHRAVEMARIRHEQLILAAPSQYGGGRSTRVRAAPYRGGFESFEDDPGAGGSGPQSRGSYRGRRYGSLRGRGPAPGNSPYGPGASQSGRAAPADANPYAAIGTGTAPNSATGGPGRAGGPARSADPTAVAGQRSQATDGPAGTPKGPTPPPNGAAGSPTGTAASTNPLGRPAGSSKAAAGPAGSGGGAASGGSPGGNSTTGRPGSVGSMASQRGANWALPRSSRNAVPISRTVRIVVRQDRLVIVPDRGTVAASERRGTEVPIPGRTEAMVDQFVSTLWDHIATWGIAGKGMYWRPVIDLYVAPDAVWRAEQLKKLLDGSGLELVDKGAVLR